MTGNGASNAINQYTDIMCLSVFLSATAILIALFSFALSVYLAFRDRSHLSVEATYLSSWENMADAVFLHIVNDGRRSITARRLILESLDGETVQHELKRDERVVRLLESEDFEIALDAINSDIVGWARSQVSKAYVEDSKGRQFNAEGFVKSLSEYAKNSQHMLR